MRWWKRASKVERIAAGCWVTIFVVAIPAFFARTNTLIALAGFLMTGLGVLLAANYSGLAERLGHGDEKNTTHWRFSGCVLVVIGAGWTTAALGWGS